MEIIINFLAQILAPLSLGIVFTAILAGIFLGAFYNYKLNIPEEFVFHKAVAGWAFLAFIFMYRIFTSVATGAVSPNFFGWIGIAILWAIYCGSIYIGERGIRTIVKRLR